MHGRENGRRVEFRTYELRQSVCHTRLPFRFGAVTMTQAPLLMARVELQVEGSADPAVGMSGDLLVPRWFDKSADKSVDDNQRDLIAAARAAGEAARSAPPGTVRQLVDHVTAHILAPSAPLAPERLLHNFGIALVERAAIDAVTRALGISFFTALERDVLGLGERVVRSLPDRPLAHVEVRHTVGMADPLRASDMDGTHRRDDGLPQCLEDDVRTYGLRLFKIKVGGDRAVDLDRLLAVHRVLADTASADWQCSLDANEQYVDLDALAGLFDDLGASAEGRDLLARLLHLEQPLPRQKTFDPGCAPALRRLAQKVPLLIDEADVDATAFTAARPLGYTGVSVKNCKGVIRALDNHATCTELRAQGVAAFQSAEDLTNLPVLPLQQDLATIQALGLTHAERNGHHYFAGLDHLPPHEAAAAVAAHSDLYGPRRGGFALRIRHGRLAIGSLTCPGYGYACAVDFAARSPA
ncbi:MAG: hypothetical protein R3F56_03840 [Planctomycetota bacterium]